MPEIGIKTADGLFHPILTDMKVQKKRVVLSPAQPDQGKACIEVLYRENEVVQHAALLTAEDISSAATELDCIFDLDAEGNLSVTLQNTTTGEMQNAKVNIYQLDDIEEDDEGGMIDPEVEAATRGNTYDLDENQFVDIDESKVNEDFEKSGNDMEAEFFAETERTSDEAESSHTSVQHGDNSSNILVLIAVLLVALSLIALGAFGIFRWLRADPPPSLQATSMLLLFCIGKQKKN